MCRRRCCCCLRRAKQHRLRFVRPVTPRTKPRGVQNLPPAGGLVRSDPRFAARLHLRPDSSSIGSWRWFRWQATAPWPVVLGSAEPRPLPPRHEHRVLACWASSSAMHSRATEARAGFLRHLAQSGACRPHRGGVSRDLADLRRGATSRGSRTGPRSIMVMCAVSPRAACRRIGPRSIQRRLSPSARFPLPAARGPLHHNPAVDVQRQAGKRLPRTLMPTRWPGSCSRPPRTPMIRARGAGSGHHELLFRRACAWPNSSALILRNWTLTTVRCVSRARGRRCASSRGRANRGRHSRVARVARNLPHRTKGRFLGRGGSRIGPGRSSTACAGLTAAGVARAPASPPFRHSSPPTCWSPARSARCPGDARPPDISTTRSTRT